MRFRAIAAVLTVSGLAVLGGAAGASAAKPVATSGSDSGNMMVADCGTFEVWDEYELFWSGYVHFDREGNPVRIVQHVWGSDRLYNSVTGKSFSGTINSGEIVDLVEGQAIQSGTIFRIVVPGSGAVFLDVGRYVFDFEDGLVFLKGRHQFFEGDFEGLCAALS